MTKGETAKNNFLTGKNCSVSVALAFKDELNLPESTIKKLLIGFGGGLSRQRLVCGAVSAITVVLSYLLSDGENKAEIYAIIQKACEDFKNETGSLICGELLSSVTPSAAKSTEPTPETRTQQYYKKRPCADMCALAADITEKYLKTYSI